MEKENDNVIKTRTHRVGACRCRCMLGICKRVLEYLIVRPIKRACCDISGRLSYSVE